MRPNEIRVKADHGIARYFAFANAILTDTTNSGKDGNDRIIIKGMSAANENVVKLAELIKTKIKGLH